MRVIELATDWGRTTPMADRTVENLIEYLRSHGRTATDLFERVGQGHEGAQEAMAALKAMFKPETQLKVLAGLLAHLGIEYRISRRLADSVLRPPLTDLTDPSYRYVLDTCLEHSWIWRAIIRGLDSPLQLQILPVYAADGDLIAWLYDPWAGTVYRYFRGGGQASMTGQDDVMSRGDRSTCTIWRGDLSPTLRRMVAQSDAIKAAWGRLEEESACAL